MKPASSSPKPAGGQGSDEGEKDEEEKDDTADDAHEEAIGVTRYKGAVEGLIGQPTASKGGHGEGDGHGSHLQVPQALQEGGQSQGDHVRGGHATGREDTQARPEHQPRRSGGPVNRPARIEGHKAAPRGRRESRSAHRPRSTRGGAHGREEIHVGRAHENTKEGHLWFNPMGKPFKRKNKTCMDGKKNLGHGSKLCPNKENKAHTSKFGGGKAGVDPAHTRRNAGVGPAAAVSANHAPPTGPQECVGQEDATGQGEASKSSLSPFA